MESAKRGLPQPRVQVINRQQMVLRPMEVDQLIPLDHPARAIWELVGQRDLSRFYAEIKAVEGTAGREAVDPWGPVPAPALAVMRAIKQEFDPTGVLNPGRFVGTL